MQRAAGVFAVLFLTGLVFNAPSFANSLAEQLVKVSKNDKLWGSKAANQMAKLQRVDLQFVEISDSAGLVYVGAYIDKDILTPYLAKMKSLTGEERFSMLRKAQQKRDHNQFHLTLINPFEYQELSPMQRQQVLNLPKLEVGLIGVGQVEQWAENNSSTETAKKSKLDTGVMLKQSYFVVAQSNEAQFIRRQLGLKDKDFHVTLGFSPTDIYGVAKNTSTLVK